MEKKTYIAGSRAVAWSRIAFGRVGRAGARGALLAENRVSKVTGTDIDGSGVQLALGREERTTDQVLFSGTLALVDITSRRASIAATRLASVQNSGILSSHTVIERFGNQGARGRESITADRSSGLALAVVNWVEVVAFGLIPGTTV